MPELISSIDQISPQWLQSVFRESGRENGNVIPPITQVTVEPIGHGNSGSTVRAVIEYETQTAGPDSVVCKLHSNVPEVFQATKAAGVFSVESNALTMMANGFDAAIPEVYFVDVSPDGGEFNLVCEDLSTVCELGDQITGCSITQAESAVRELAKMHRQFWNEPVLNDLHWIIPRQELPENIIELVHDRLTELLNEEQYEIVKRGVPLVFDWLKRAPANKTLIHTDCRADNILFDNRPDSPGAYLIDFALVNIGDAADDLAYFLTSSLSPEDRLACEMDLLELHTEIVAEKDPSYTFEKAREAYLGNIVSSFYLTLVATMGMPDSPHGRLLLGALFERNCAAVEHWAL